jgi:Domain of unknown function (DUF1918)
MPAKVQVEHSPAAAPGDRIVVDSERVGQPPREGEIVEITDSPAGPTFEVRWDDGRRTGFRPAAGSARIIRAEKREKA